MTGTLTHGEIVSWESPSSVTFEALKEAVAKLGVDGSFLREMLPRNAFARAACKLAEDRVIAQTAEEGSTLYFQFTRQLKDVANREVDYWREAVLKLDKNTGDVEIHSAASLNLEEQNALVAQVKQLMGAEIGNRTASDVTAIVQRLFVKKSSDLVAIRSAGGCYFVPQSQVELVDAVQEMLEAIGGQIRRFVVGASEQTSKSIADSMASHLHRLVEEFRQSCEVVDNTSSPAVLRRRVDRHAELKFKLGQFRELLAGHGAEVETALNSAKAEFEARKNGTARSLPEPQEPEAKKAEDAVGLVI